MIFAHLFQTASNPPTDVSALESSISALERAISALESELKALESRSVPWEYSVWVFTFLVLFGVALELWVIRHDWREEMEAWALGHFGIVRLPGRPSLRKLRIEIASVLLITLGIAGELGVGIEIASIAAQIRGKGAELRSKNAELRIASDQLVALITSEAEEAKKQAKAADLARVKIEAAVAFRSLDDKQKRDIGTTLARFGAITGASMWFANGSTEAELFADDIAKTLRSAHIHTTTIGGITDMREGGGHWDEPIEPANTGVDITSTNNPVARELADALFKELTSRGFDSKRQLDQKSKNNPPGPVIWVTVQARPIGPQGEYKLQAEREAKAKKATSTNTAR